MSYRTTEEIANQLQHMEALHQENCQSAHSAALVSEIENLQALLRKERYENARLLVLLDELSAYQEAS